MKQFLYYTTITILLLSCNQKESKISSVKSNVIEENADSIVHEEENEKRIKFPETIGKLYAYEDSVEVYEQPSDTSRIIGYLNYPDNVDRIKVYVNRSGRLVLTEPYLHAVLFKRDTGWIFDSYKVSPILDVDTLNNVILKKYYGQVEVCGYGCLSKTKVIDFKSGKVILEMYGEINFLDSITYTRNILYTDWEIFDYDSQFDSLIFHSYAVSTKLSEISGMIYFIRSRVSSQKGTPVELVKYDPYCFETTILYKEPDFTTNQCTYWEDGADCTELKIADADSTETLTFNVYKEKENLKHAEPTYDRIEICVDSNGKLLYRKNNGT